jgi:hypothetical protein
MRFNPCSHGLFLTALLALGLSWQARAQTAPKVWVEVLPLRTTTAAGLQSPAAVPSGTANTSYTPPPRPTVGNHTHPSAPPNAGWGAVAGSDGVWLQFINTDIASVARSLGAVTGRQVVVDTRVQGQLSLQSAQAVPPAQAWDLFQQALHQRGWRLVATQGLYLIAPQDKTVAAETAPPPSVPSKTASISASAPTPAHPGAASAFEITVEWAKPPKPTLPNPSGSADAVRLPSPEPDAVWTLQTQDKTLYHSLSRWAQAAQWQLMWEAERDFPIQAQISIEGSFSAAVQLVMNALSNTDHPLQAVMNEATRVMSIVRHQQRNDS